jgi:hypothetical protein
MPVILRRCWLAGILCLYLHPTRHGRSGESADRRQPERRYEDVFNWLQANRSSAGLYNNSMYLDVVEAGLEVTRGDGWAYVTANINAD